MQVAYDRQRIGRTKGIQRSSASLTPQTPSFLFVYIFFELILQKLNSFFVFCLNTKKTIIYTQWKKLQYYQRTKNTGTNFHAVGTKPNHAFCL